MIHDIDLALTLTNADPLAVEASARITHGPFIDECTAEVTLDDGCGLKLSASRISETRERRMRIVFPSGEVRVDFLRNTLTARGLVANLREHTIRLESRINGRFKP